MKKINDGGSAFPTDGEHQPDAHFMHYEGMSLRVYIAIHAPAEEIAIMVSPYSSRTYLEEICAARYRYADEMLKAREPKKDGE